LKFEQIKDIIKRYKMAFAMILAIPAIVNIALCFMLQSGQIRDIPTAVYLGDNSQLSRSIVDYFDSSDFFSVQLYVDSPYEIEELIRDNRVRFALLIPENFSRDVKNLNSPTILTVYDGTQLGMTSFAKLQASQTLMTLKAGALIKLIQAKLSVPYDSAYTMASSISINSRILFNPTRNYTNFLMPGFMTALVQAGLSMSAAVSTDSSRRKSIPVNVASRTAVFALMGLSSLLLNIFIQVRFFNVPLRGSHEQLFWLSAMYMMVMSAAGVAISSTIGVWDKVKAAQLAALMFLPNTILAGYTWPVLSMPIGYQRAAYFIPFYHYADNLRDLMLIGCTPHFKADIAYFSASLAVLTLVSISGGFFSERLEKKVHKASGDTVEGGPDIEID